MGYAEENLEGIPLELEVGKRYLARGGWQAEVIEDHGTFERKSQFYVSHETDEYSTGIYHAISGKCNISSTDPDYDLVSEIKEVATFDLEEGEGVIGSTETLKITEPGEITFQDGPNSFPIGEIVIAPHGGPSSYYDFPFDQWTTTNDMIEYLAEEKWGPFAVSFKDVFKALCRWGDKNGTTYEYDAKKIIYYGCRVLRKVVGEDALRKYLQELLDDKQFGG